MNGCEGVATAKTVAYPRDLPRTTNRRQWIAIYWRLRMSKRRLRAAKMVGPNEVYIPSADEVSRPLDDEGSR